MLRAHLSPAVRLGMAAALDTIEMAEVQPPEPPTICINSAAAEHSGRRTEAPSGNSPTPSLYLTPPIQRKGSILNRETVSTHSTLV